MLPQKTIGRPILPPSRWWKNLESGMVYREICRAEMQAGVNKGNIVVIYQEMNGKLWARREREFEEEHEEHVD